MAKCTDCSLAHKCKSNKIDGKGDTSAKIMIVLDAPSRVEDNFNALAVGEIKQKLLYFLSHTKIEASDIYITSAIRCKPNNLSDIKAKHIKACRKYLFHDIVTVKPKIIIAMGKVAYQALSDNTSITDFRGHFDEFKLNYGEESFKCKVMPTFSVYSSLGKWEYDNYIIHDLNKAYNYLKTGEIPVTPIPEYKVILNLKDLEEFKNYMLSGEVKWCTSDLETTGFKFHNDQPFMNGYCTDTNKIFILYTKTYLKEHTKKWDKENIERAREVNRFIKQHGNKVKKVIREVNANKDIKWIFHNGKFDLNFARFHGYPYSNIFYDTLLADSLIDENAFHSLNMAMEYRGINFGAYDTELWPYTNKDEKKKKTYQNIPPYMCEKYLAIDVYGLKLLFPHTVKELKKDNLYDHFLKNKMPMLRLMTNVEYSGVKADRKLIETVNDTLTNRIKELEKQARELTKIPNFNMGSPDQLCKYFTDNDFPLDKLGIKKTKKGYSTGKEELEKLMKYKKYAALPTLVLEYKKLTKLAGTYIAGKIDDEEEGGMLQHLDSNDRIHASFNLWTARTGRFSVRSPSTQVWPRPVKGLPNIRNVITKTDDSWVLFEADFKALEQYVVAVLSKDITLTKRLQDGTDIHSFNAVELGKQLGTMPDDITYDMMLSMVKDIEETGFSEEKYNDLRKQAQEIAPDLDWKEKRTQSKTIGFGLNYGKGQHSYAEEFGISESDAEDMIEAYFRIYKGMKKWRDEIVEEALNVGYITLLSGRRRRFTQAANWIKSKYSKDLWQANKLKEEISRQAMNFPVQGGAHEIFEAAKLRLMNRLKKEGIVARLLLSIHDGILGECKKEDAPKVKRIMLEEMPQIFNAGTKFELKVDIDCDFYKDCWYGEKLKIDVDKPVGSY